MIIYFLERFIVSFLLILFAFCHWKLFEDNPSIKTIDHFIYALLFGGFGFLNLSTK